MKQILCIFTLCTLLALGFTACQTEDPLTLELQQQEMKKRDSKKHPKLEYVTTVENNNLSSPPKMHYYLEDNNSKLEIRFLLDSKEKVNVSFSDRLGIVVYEEVDMVISQWKMFNINPAEKYPYYFILYSKNFEIKGKVYIE